jgi:leucine dehydrogenase
MARLDIPGFDEVHRIDCAGSTAFIALHAVLSGRAFGGIRIRRYPTEDHALKDALALARAMSRKVVMAGIPGGGAKAVLLEPERDRGAAVRTLGAFVESLGGRYRCGSDYGFTEEDDAAIREVTRYMAIPNLAPDTSESVLIAMDAVISPRVVAIQGLGAVGRPLAEGLRARGVRVVVSDVRPVDASEGWEVVPPEAIYDVPCDVFAPCAMGEVLNEETIGRLRCKVVCGAANNPLASEADGERLRAREITYVPDFIANSGATIRGASTSIGETHLIAERMAKVREITRAVIERAAREGRSTHAVAVAMADERIAAARSRGVAP